MSVPVDAPAMHWRQLSRRSVSIALVAGALISAGLVDAHDGVSAHRCTTARAAAPEASGLSRSALRTYDDPTGDVRAGPDVCGGIVTNDNVAITAGIRVDNRSGFEPFDSYSLLVDTDSNPETGAVADGGAEYLVDVSGRTSALTVWNGSSFEIVVPQPRIPTAWLEGFGPIVRIGRRALGDPTAFEVVVTTRTGTDTDRAPNTGSWAYRVEPLALTPGRPHVGQAAGGRQLVAWMRVIRSDFDVPLDSGRVRCRASVSGEPLAGRGIAMDGRISCSWRVPADAHRGRVHGSVAVTFEGVTATRSFSVVVR